MSNLFSQVLNMSMTGSVVILLVMLARLILKRLCDRELFRNEGGKVTSLVSREELYARQSEMFVEETFNGSLPAFLAAFGSRKKPSDSEIDELQKVIDTMRG